MTASALYVDPDTTFGERPEPTEAEQERQQLTATTSDLGETDDGRDQAILDRTMAELTLD